MEGTFEGVLNSGGEVDMELLDITRGHVTVGFDGRTATIYGEALLRGQGSPDFVVYANTIEKWNPPHANEEIAVEAKSKIIQFLREEFARRNMTVEIE